MAQMLSSEESKFHFHPVLSTRVSNSSSRYLNPREVNRLRSVKHRLCFVKQ
jgi:hypothetical protein